MSTQVVSLTFPAGTTMQNIIVAAHRSVLEAFMKARGLDPLKALPADAAALANNILPTLTPIMQAAQASAGSGPITVAVVIDSSTGTVVPSATLAKNHVTLPASVATPGFAITADNVHSFTPPLASSPLEMLSKIGGTAGGAVVGAMAGGPVGLVVGAVAGGAIDFMRAKAKKG